MGNIYGTMRLTYLYAGSVGAANAMYNAKLCDAHKHIIKNYIIHIKIFA